MRLRTIVLSALLSIPISFAAADNIEDVYNLEKKEFIESLGGIDEVVANKHVREFSDYEIAALIAVDECERTLSFLELDKEDEEYLYLDSMRVAHLNYDHIKKVDTTELADNPLMKNLNTLVERLNGFKPLPEYERASMMHKVISESLNTEGISIYPLPLNLLLEGEPADNNDIVPAYHALFEYYGIDSKINVSYILISGVKSPYQWLTLTIDGREFDFDPFFYGSAFVPLEKRVIYPQLKRPKQPTPPKYLAKADINFL